jgi:ABC-type sulfate transport system permease subunit
LLTVHVPVVVVVVVALALGVGVAVAAAADADVAAAVGVAVLLGAAAPPHAASRKLVVASGTAIREKYREIIGSSALCSTDLTRPEGLSR